MKKIILNVDDFGMSETINESIANTFDAGMISSASLLVNSVATDHAIAIARRRPSLGLGLHINLDQFFNFEIDGHFGGTVTDIDEDRYYYYTHMKPDAVEAEIERQIHHFRAFGLEPTHLDGHHHIHLFPGVFPLVIQAALRHNIRKMRFSRNFYDDREDIYSLCRNKLIESAISYPDHCQDFDEVQPLGSIFALIQPGITEFIVHTDMPNGDGGEWRTLQYQYLLSAKAKETVQNHGLEFCTFHQVGAKASYKRWS